MDRITSLLQQANQMNGDEESAYGNLTSLLQNAQPYGQPMSDMDRLGSYVGSMATGGDYQTNVRQEQDRRFAAQTAGINNAKDLVAAVEAKIQAGDRRYQNMLSKIDLFANEDPEGRQMFLQELMNDPDEIDPANSAQVISKLGQIAKRTGYKNPVMDYERRKRELDLKSMEADIYRTYKSAESSGSGGSGGTEFERLTNRMNTLLSKEQLTPIEKNELGLLQTRLNTAARGGMDPASRAFGSSEGKTYAEAKAALPTVEQTTARALANIDYLLNSKSLTTQTGMAGTVPTRPGSPGRAFNKKFDQLLEGDAFMNGIQALQGMGALSNAEGDAARRSFTSLDRTLDPEDFKAELQNLKNYLETGLRNARNMAKYPVSQLPMSEPDAPVENTDTPIDQMSTEELLKLING